MGMGTGGGGLLVIYFTLYLGMGQRVAQGTNLLLFAIAGGFSIIYHLRKRKLVPWQIAVMLLFGIPGSLLLSRLAVAVDPHYPRIALGVLLIISGALTLYNILIKPIVKKFKKTLYK